MARRDLIVNGEAVVNAREAIGFITRADLHRHLKRLSTPISLDVLERCERSPGIQHRARPITLKILADALHVELQTLVVAEDDTGGNPIRQRDCSGVWSVRGGDIVVPNHFDYPNGPKPLAAKIVIKVSGTTVKADGHDHDGDVVRLKGWLEEGGDHIVANYEVLNHRMRIYGTVHLQYLACGKKMKGWYLGRETGHGLPYILGYLELTLQEESVCS